MRDMISLLVLLLFISSRAEVIEVFSLRPPFNDFNRNGARIVSKEWISERDASIKENFIRLTPDIPGKVGVLQSVTSLNMEAFSISLKFRISGQGKSLFGDGLALWIHDRKSLPGRKDKFNTVHGHPDQFYGFGILFDTYRDKDQPSLHKDISLVKSDGKTPIVFEKARPSCISRYRFYEGRDSFSTSLYAEAKITINGDFVSLKIDRDGSGKFIQCFNARLSEGKIGPSLKKGWIKDRDVSLSLTADTKTYSDNHDIVQLIVTEGQLEKVLDNLEAESNAVSVEISDTFDSSQVSHMAETINALEKRVKMLEANLEHKVEGVEQKLTSMIENVEGEELLGRERIKDLERNRAKIEERNYEKRIKQLEQKAERMVKNEVSKMDLKFKDFDESTSNYFWIVVFGFLLITGLVGWNIFSVKKLAARDKLA